MGAIQRIAALAILAAACGRPPGDGLSADAGSRADPSRAYPTATGAGDPGPQCAGLASGSACGICGAVECGELAVACAPGPEVCPLFESVPIDGAVGGGGLQFGSGIAFGDVDGDGRVDAVVGSAERALLYIGTGAGFKRTDQALVGGSPTNVGSVTLVDFDGDGDLDLFMTSREPAPGLHLRINDGTGRFRDASGEIPLPAMARPFGAAWGDFDRDGWLDVFIAGYLDEPSKLLRNVDGQRFEDVTHLIAADTAPQASLQPVWIDYDADGDLDLFVSNDFGPATGFPSSLYRNDGGDGFVLVSAEAGITELIYGMGIGVFDADADGDLDLYVTNIGWAAGGQKLYLNNGDGTFVERADEFGLAAYDRWGWGAEPIDVDNDGDADMALAAAFPASGWFAENKGEQYLDITYVAGDFPLGNTLYGVATADFDADGNLDIGWTTLDPLVGTRLYRNVHPDPGHWLRIRLAAPAPNTRAIGATVIVVAGGRRRAAAILAGNSYLSSSEPVAHFGLGDLQHVDSIEVRWPDGSVTYHDGPFTADQVIRLEP